MEKMRISYGSALMFLFLAACGGATTPAVPGAQRATTQRTANAPYLYYGCCGTGSGSYTWARGSQHCAGSVDAQATISLELMKDGKVIPVSRNTGIVVTAKFDSICADWGASQIQFMFDINRGTVIVNRGVSVEGTVKNFFCLPGSASGDATLVGSVDNAHLFLSKIAAHCKDFDYSISFTKMLIHDIPGQVYYH